MDEIDTKRKHNETDQGPAVKNQKIENNEPESLGSPDRSTIEFTKYSNINSAILEVFDQIIEEVEEKKKEKRRIR